MRRLRVTPRQGWQEIVESQGLVFHTLDGVPYWDESVCYAFEAAEIDLIEKAAADLQALCLEAAQHVISKKLYDRFHIPAFAIPLIEEAWEAEPPAIYGRFDLAYDGENPPKLLEYNADTPTSLLEASAVQWFWLGDVFPKADQFNSIHEKLVGKWRELREYLRSDLVHTTSVDVPEDVATAFYMRDTAAEAGLKTKYLTIDAIGWDDSAQCFVDEQNEPIQTLFKLYPWEWMVHEDFAKNIPHALKNMDVLEPVWKMLLSNKAILPILWELFPNHPNLLPAYADGPRDLVDYVSKPILGREGANVTIFQAGKAVAGAPGPYGEEGYIHQALAPIPDFDGAKPVIGAWMIDQDPAGMGIRETQSRVTDNFSRFVPHYFT